jgi:hypothetical protein
MSSSRAISSSYAWSGDSLSTYLRRSEENTFASSVNLGPDFIRLVAIHELWIRAATALTHTGRRADRQGSPIRLHWFVFLRASSVDTGCILKTSLPVSFGTEDGHLRVR